MEKTKKFMKLAIKSAAEGIKKKDGGPFGACIVDKRGKIIAVAHNTVWKGPDATAHAEINAIRKACRKLKTIDLSGCTLYSTAEPCPMCFGAIHWAKMRKVYYGCTAKDAAAIGFDDKYIYDVIRGTAKKKQVKMIKLDREECLQPFVKWKKLKGKRY